MSPQTDPISAAARPATGDYQRHRPEHTLLYQLVERHYLAFVKHLAEAGKQLPTHVLQAFDGYLQCGRLERDTEQLDLGEARDNDDPMPDLAGHSITYRIAVGPHRGRKVFTLQTLPICDEEDWATGGPGNVAGFSLHAGVADGSSAGGDFVQMDYAEPSEILRNAGRKFEYQPEWGVDLQTEHERFLTEQHCKAPVVVKNYPDEIKAFYMRQNDDGKTIAAMDVLAPGIGEIIGGSQREERLDILKQRMEHHAWMPKPTAGTWT